MITEYTIIDVLENTFTDIADLQSAISKAKRMSQTPEHTYTLDEFCKFFTTSETPSNALKWYIRGHKQPSQVFIICDSLLQYKYEEKIELSNHAIRKGITKEKSAKWVAPYEAWENKDIKQYAFAWENHCKNVGIITSNLEYFTMDTFKYENQRRELSDNEKILLSLWQDSIDFSFSTRPFHDDFEAYNHTEYAKEHDYIYREDIFDEQKKEWITRYTVFPKTNKQFTATESYNSNRAVPTKEELDIFQQYVDIAMQDLGTFVDIDFQICPHCGKPIRIAKHQFDIKQEVTNLEQFNQLVAKIPETSEDVTCQHCGKFRIPKLLLVSYDRYFDDSYNEKEDDFIR